MYTKQTSIINEADWMSFEKENIYFQRRIRRKLQNRFGWHSSCVQKAGCGFILTKIKRNNTIKWLERRSTLANEEVRRLFQLMTLIHGVGTTESKEPLHTSNQPINNLTDTIIDGANHFVAVSNKYRMFVSY